MTDICDEYLVYLGRRQIDTWTKLGSKSSEGWFQIDYILAKCRYWNSVRTASCEAVKLEIYRLDNVQASCHVVM